MMTLVAGLIGIAMLFLFLGIMLWWVPEVPLIVIVVGTAILLLYDFIRTVRYGNQGGR